MANDKRAMELGTLILNAAFRTTIAKTKTFDILMSDMPNEAIMVLLGYGVQRKFNDAVGGADKSAETKVELAEAMIADYKAGKIGRVPTARVPELQVAIRNVVRKLYMAKMDDKAKAEWRAMEPDARNAKLDELFAKQPEDKAAKITAQAEADMEIARKAKEEAEKLAATVGGLDL